MHRFVEPKTVSDALIVKNHRHGGDCLWASCIKEYTEATEALHRLQLQNSSYSRCSDCDLRWKHTKCWQKAVLLLKHQKKEVLVTHIAQKIDKKNNQHLMRISDAPRHNKGLFDHLKLLQMWPQRTHISGQTQHQTKLFIQHPFVEGNDIWLWFLVGFFLQLLVNI